jgi:hypothetical protein
MFYFILREGMGGGAEYGSQDRDWATRWMIRGFEFRQGQDIYLLSKTSRPTLGPTKTLIHWLPKALSWGDKAAGTLGCRLTTI